MQIRKKRNKNNFIYPRVSCYKANDIRHVQPTVISMYKIQPKAMEFVGSPEPRADRGILIEAEF